MTGVELRDALGHVVARGDTRRCARIAGTISGCERKVL